MVRSREDFLALGDDTLVEHVSTRLMARGLAADGDTLSQVEHEVLLADLAFRVMSAGGTRELLTSYRDDLPSMTEALRQLGLRRHADVVRQLLARAPGPDHDHDDLVTAWSAIEDNATARVAAYLRRNAAEVAWQRMG